MVIYLALWLEISGEEAHKDGDSRQHHIQLLPEEHPKLTQVPVRDDVGGEHGEPNQQDEVEAVLGKVSQTRKKHSMENKTNP